MSLSVGEGGAIDGSRTEQDEFGSVAVHGVPDDDGAVGGLASRRASQILLNVHYA
jgi:hypothetical protein